MNGWQATFALRTVNEAESEFRLSLSLKNACLLYYDDRSTMHRPFFLLEDEEAPTTILHGFSERALGYQRLAVARPAQRHERRALSQCKRRKLGVGIPVSHVSSIYHQLFHALPAWEAWQTLRTSLGLDTSTAPTFFPLMLAEAGIGYSKSVNTQRWHGWEFSLRPFTSATAAEIQRSLTSLLRAPCTCFERIEVVSTAFNPGAPSAAPRLRGFRAAALQNMGMLVSAPVPRALQGSTAAMREEGALLLVSRSEGRRSMDNEKALLLELRTVPRVVRLVLEDLSLAQQMSAVSRATALIGVHGQALAWVVFLPPHRRVALVEITPRASRHVRNQCYEVWSKALSVKFYRVTALIAGNCDGGATRRDNAAARFQKILRCNVTVDVPATAKAIISAAKWTAQGRSSNKIESAHRVGLEIRDT